MKRNGLFACFAILLVQGTLVFSARAGGNEAPPGARGGEVPSVAMSEPPKAPPLPEPLPGQLSSKFRVDDRSPEESVPTTKERDGDPLEYGYFLQDLIFRAENARRASDYAAVIRYYRAVAKAVPETATAWSKLCEAYEIVQDRDRAIRACQYALVRKGVELPDYTRYVHLLLGKDGPLSAEDRKEVMGVFAHLDKQPGLELSTSTLRCEMGVKENDVAAMETCTQVLRRLAPEDPKTVVFQWNLAVQKGQRAEAEQLLVRARKAGVVLENLARMEKVASSDGRFSRALIGGAAVFGVAGLVAWALRRRRLMRHRMSR
ncbi:MAG: hypothetical protein ABUS79_05630, partial [Pseudomonadota bacterium]